jgi:hypothetical protein
MSDDDLAEALSELEETCTTAERELKAIRGRIQNRQKTSPRNTSPGAVPF